MKKTINLYNYFHNGDIFYSRVLTNALSEKFNINYYHSNLNLFDDVDYITEFLNIPNEYDLHQNNLESNNINTWMGQKGMVYVNSTNPGCSFENYFNLIQPILNYFDIEIKNQECYLPEINYNKIKNYESIKDLMAALKLKYKKILLISSGPVLSSQSLNFDFHSIMNKLCIDNPEILILSTYEYSNMPDNFINTNSITNVMPDLLQISYISTFCDIIVGRASGPFCFCHTKENLLNPNKIFISISNNETEGKWFQTSKAIQKWTNNYDPINIINLIQSSI